MIEYLRIDFSQPAGWYELNEKDFVPKESDFRMVNFRINNAVFEEWSDEFQHAWLLEKLTRD